MNILKFIEILLAYTHNNLFVGKNEVSKWKKEEKQLRNQVAEEEREDNTSLFLLLKIKKKNSNLWKHSSNRA